MSNLGPQRTVWSFSDEQGNLGGLSPETIEVEILDASLRTIHQTTACGIPTAWLAPYYPVIVPFQNSEVHEFRFDLGARDVRRLRRYLEQNRLVRLCGQAINFRWCLRQLNPTPAGSRRFAPVSLRARSTKYLLTLSASPNATVVIVSTPAFCGTKWMCGPVLENLVSEVGKNLQDVM